MYSNRSIFISHDFSDAEKAKELADALLQIPSVSIEDIGYLDTILPGKHVKEEIFDQIEKADLILLILSRKYLASCKEEISWIKKSNCYKNRKVMPVPVSPCVWRDVFPDIMPLPRESMFHEIPFDEHGLFKIVSGIRSVLDNVKLSANKYMPIMLARADSHSNEHSQEFPSDYFGISLKYDEILVPIQGDSMSPLYEEGDYVICKPINFYDAIISKNNTTSTFVIRTKILGTLLKYIGSVSSNCVILCSENSMHDPIELEIEEIDSMFIVVKSIKIRSEM